MKRLIMTALIAGIVALALIKIPVTHLTSSVEPVEVIKAASCAVQETTENFLALGKSLNMTLTHNTTNMQEITMFLEALGYTDPIKGSIDQVILFYIGEGAIDGQGNAHPNIDWAFVVAFKDNCEVNGLWIPPQAIPFMELLTP